MKINYLALLAAPALLLTLPLAANVAVGEELLKDPRSSTFTAQVPNALPKDAAKLAWRVVYTPNGTVVYRAGWRARPYGWYRGYYYRW